MITDLNEILVEWSYRTSDGKPDVKNRAKLLILENVLNDFGWTREARAELLSSLMEAPKQKGDKIDPETKVKYKIKDKDGKDVDKETTYKSAISREKDSPAYIAAKALQGDDGEKDDGEKLDTGPEFDRNVDSNKGIDPDYERPVGDDDVDDGEKKRQKTIERANEVSKKLYGEDGKGDLLQNSKTTEQALEFGYAKGEDWVAPGNAGSNFNENMSNEGALILQEEDLSEEELSEVLFNKVKDTTLGKQQKKTSVQSPHNKDTGNVPSELSSKEKDLYSLV